MTSNQQDWFPKAEPPSKVRPWVRYMVRRDLLDVQILESYSSPWPLSEDQILNELRRSDRLSVVAEVGECIAGYMTYMPNRNGKRYDVLRLLVHPRWRRQGVGRHLLDYLTTNPGRREQGWVRIDVDEYALPLQLFVFACGYKAVEIIKGLGGLPDLYRFMKELDIRRI